MSEFVGVCKYIYKSLFYSFSSGILRHKQTSETFGYCSFPEQRKLRRECGRVKLVLGLRASTCLTRPMHRNLSTGALFLLRLKVKAAVNVTYVITKAKHERCFKT